MKYKVLRTELADEQLNTIINYIFEEFGYDAALSYIEDVENASSNLATMPELGVVPRFRMLKKQGYRILIIGHTLIFYKINEDAKEVIIHAVVDSRQDYIDLIK